MAIRPVLHYPHPTLKSESSPTLPSDPATPVVVQDLLDTLAASPGVALAAPQIGYALRVIVVDVSRKKGEKGTAILCSDRDTEWLVEAGGGRRAVA